MAAGSGWHKASQVAPEPGGREKGALGTTHPPEVQLLLGAKINTGHVPSQDQDQLQHPMPTGRHPEAGTHHCLLSPCPSPSGYFYLPGKKIFTSDPVKLGGWGKWDRMGPGGTQNTNAPTRPKGNEAIWACPSPLATWRVRPQGFKG